MNVFTILSAIAFFANVLLGCYIFYRNPKDKLNKLYSLFAFSLAIWALGTFLGSTSSTPDAAMNWGKLVVASTAIMSAFLLHFFLVFTKKEDVLRKIFYFPLYLPALFFIIIHLTTNLIHESAELSYWGYSYVAGTLYTLIAVYIIGYFIIGILLCYGLYSKTSIREEKIQARFLIIAILIPLVGGTITEAIPRVIKFEVIPLSTLFITISAVIVAYTILKHRLMAPLSLNIQRKLVAGFLIITLLVGLVGYASITQSQETLERSIGESSTMLAQQTLDKIDRNIYNRMEEVNIYTHDLILQEAVINSNLEFENLDNIQDYIDEKDKEWTSTSQEEITPFMQELIDNELSDELREKIEFYEEKYGYKVYGEIFVTNKHGTNVAQTGKTSDYYQADEDWWQNAKEDSFYVEDVEYDESAGIYSIAIAIGIYDENGNFLGVTKAVLNIEEVFSMITELQLSEIYEKYETMHFDLMDKDGKLIYSTKREFEIFEDLSDEGSMIKALENDNNYFVSKCETTGKEELFANAHSKGYKDYKSLGWVLIIMHDADEIFAPITQMRNSILIISLFLLIIAILLSIFISRSFSKPIVQLSNATKKISEGNLDVDIKVKSKDEVGDLAKSLEAMKNSLIDAQKALEKKVEERTKDLNEKITEVEQNEAATMSILEDMHEIHEGLKKSQIRIKRQNIKLKKLDQIKSNFLNVTSHELRTPMSAIKGYIQMILKQTLGKTTEDQRNALNVVLRNTDRLDHLIQDILDISRLESGTLKLIPEKIDVKKMMEETVETMQSSADLKHITINAKVEDNIPEITVDQERIKQVIINIISNAIKFSPDGSIINIRSKKDKDLILLEIQDFGRGIPKDKQKRIFETFYQVDSGMDRKFGGAGLGLAISRGIVLAHGGEIWVESIVGKGSIFYFTISIKPVVSIGEEFKGIDIFGLENGGV